MPDMPGYLIALLVAIPQLAGLILLTCTNKLRLSKTIGLASMLAQLALALWGLCTITGAETPILVSQMGAWKAPFGITLVFDSLSGLLLAASCVVAIGAYIHSFGLLDEDRQRRYFHPLMQFLLFGVNVSFMTGDIFNLFVGFEIMLLSSYCLMVSGTSFKQMKHAYKYVLLNILGGALFLMAAGLTYGMFGTLNMADLARLVQLHIADGTLPAGFYGLAGLFLVVFALKGAFFPLWYWLPDTYHTIPTSIAGLFGGLLTKVGVYTIARLFPLIFAWHADGDWNPLIQGFLIVSAIFTMFLGVLGAVSQHHVRRILAIHVISQVGYMIFGLAMMTEIAIAAVAFYAVQHMVVKCCLFLCCGMIEKHAGTDKLSELGGLLKRDRLLGTLMLIAALSLVGLPPLSGFFGKMVLIQEGFTAQDGRFWYLSVVGLITGALTLLSMLKIFGYAFWNPPNAPVVQTTQELHKTQKTAYFGIGLLVGIALFLGLCAPVVYWVADTAGYQMGTPEGRQQYINTVLEIQPAEVNDVQ